MATAWAPMAATGQGRATQHPSGYVVTDLYHGGRQSSLHTISFNSRMASAKSLYMRNMPRTNILSTNHSQHMFSQLSLQPPPNQSLHGGHHASAALIGSSAVPITSGEQHL